MICAPLMALSYPLAISMPKKDDEAINLVKLSILIGATLSCLFIFINFIFDEKLLYLFNSHQIPSFWLLVPIALFLNVIIQTYQQWFIRIRAYKSAVKISITQSLITNTSKLALGLIYASPLSLILINILGSLVNVTMLVIHPYCKVIRSISTQVEESLNFKSLKFVAKNYIDFAIFRTPQILINAISLNIPVIALSAFFGAKQAGFYAISSLALNIPSLIFGKSVSDALYPKLVDAERNNGNIYFLISKATLVMASIGIIPFLLLLFFAEPFFAFLLGEKWRMAGNYASCLSAMIFFGFINRPVVAVIPVMNLQAWLLKYEVLSSLTKIIFLFLGLLLIKNDIWAIALFSFSGAVAYIYLILKIIHLAKIRYR